MKSAGHDCNVLVAKKSSFNWQKVFLSNYSSWILLKQLFLSPSLATDSEPIQARGIIENIYIYFFSFSFFFSSVYFTSCIRIILTKGLGQCNDNLY